MQTAAIIGPDGRPVITCEGGEILGYIRSGRVDEPFEFRGTIRGGRLEGALLGAAEAQPEAGPPAVVRPARPPEKLPRKARGRLCVNCNERDGEPVMVLGPRGERAVPRVLCTTCIANLWSAGEILSAKRIAKGRKG